MRAASSWAPCPYTYTHKPPREKQGGVSKCQTAIVPLAFFSGKLCSPLSALASTSSLSPHPFAFSSLPHFCSFPSNPVTASSSTPPFLPLNLLPVLSRFSSLITHFQAPQTPDSPLLPTPRFHPLGLLFPFQHRGQLQPPEQWTPP